MCERGRERRSSGGMETHRRSDVRVRDGERDWWREKRPPLQTLGNAGLIFVLSSISRALSSLIQQFTDIGRTWISQSPVHVCVCACVCTVSRASMLAQHRVYLHIYTYIIHIFDLTWNSNSSWICLILIYMIMGDVCLCDGVRLCAERTCA